ncbi:MAG TPA: hypothetical protein PLP57_05190 [Candidatus Saccharicenans sp.]|jgi:hypothetical protein|nr:hypothetical protein [Candidatus Saccharicenans sp.]
MEFIRAIENPRKCMQRLGFLKWLAFYCSKSATSNLSILGNNLISTVSKKILVPVTEELILYIKSALVSPVHRGIFAQVNQQKNEGDIKKTISVELQDAYLSSFDLPSRRGRLAKDEWFEYPSLAIGLALIKKGTYSLSVRGVSFLSLVIKEEIDAFKQYDKEFNPFKMSMKQKLLLLYCLVDNDGQMLKPLYKDIIKKDNTFSDIEASESLDEIFSGLLKESRPRVRSGDDIKRIQRIEKTIERLKTVKGKPSTGGGGVRHETIAVRLEPFVDLGLLLKPDPFAYRYRSTDATKSFFEPLICSDGIDVFLRNSFFSTVNSTYKLDAVHHTGRDIVLPAIQKAFITLKSPLGYAPILEVSLLAAINSITENRTFFELSECLEILKSIQKERPELVRFNVDRWGTLTFVKFNGDITKAIGA